MSSEVLQRKGYSISKLWYLALNASWGSFILGYNAGVFTSCQPSVAATLHWGSQTDLMITLMSSFIPLGSMFGALSSGYLARRFGRRKALILSDLLTLIGVGIIIIPYTATFAIGRLITGFTSGCFGCLVPLYINEISPLEMAGKVGGLVQLQITFGIVVAYALALGLPTSDYNSDPRNYLWIGIFAFQTIFVLLQLVAFLFIIKNETPKWLLENGKHGLLLNSLKDIYDDESAAEALSRLEESNKKSVVEVGIDSLEREEPTYKEILLCQNKLGKMIRLGCFINFFQQFSGINAILSYSTEIFASIGGGVFLARVFTLVMGIINMISTLAVFPLIEKAGRKKLILFGGIGMSISLFSMGLFSGEFKALGIAPPILCIMLFIIFYESSIGPVCWIYCGEILTARAMSVCIFVNFLGTFIVILTFKLLVSAFSMSGAFFFYAGLNMTGFIYFCLDMVETKGIEKVQIRKLLVR